MKSKTTFQPSKRLSVKNSTLPQAGKGLFANKTITKGTKIEVIGIRMRKASLADQCTRYADAYKFRIGSDLLLPLGYGAMVNHASKPNLEKVLEKRRVYLRALRSIKPGEELFFRYSRYSQKRFL